MRALVLIAALLCALPAMAERVVLGLSQDEVAITASFDGSRLLIFGAIRRETPIPEGGPLDIVVTITGPSEAVDVRRKDRRFGIWVNTDSVRLSRAPSYYGVASTRPLDEAISATENLRHRVTIDRVMRTVGAREETEDVESFTTALLRIRAADGLFVERIGAVAVDQQTLFHTELELPTNVAEGPYATRIFLLRNRQVVDIYETVIDVRKVGLERFLYTLAQEQPLVYGVMSLVIAIAAGWLASAAFRVFQR